MLQLTYTNGENGWNIERVSGNVSKTTSEAFSRISSQCNPNQEIYTFGYDDMHFILLHSVPCGVDSANRPKFYAHGYIFLEENWEALLSDYALFLGIDYFAQSGADALYSAEEVLRKRFSKQAACPDIKGLIECVYEAVLCNKTLEILAPSSDSVTQIKQIMFTVYPFLPLSLRKFVSFSNDTFSVRRTITTVNEYSGITELKYDLSTGRAEGNNNKYLPFVEKLFTGERETYLENLDREIKNYSVYSLLDAIYYDQIFRKVLPSDCAERFLSANALALQLVHFLISGSYKSPLGLKLTNGMLEDVLKEDITTPAVLDESLLEIYNETDFAPLKDNIILFFVQKYISQSADDFASFFAIANSGSKLFHLIAEKMLESDDSAFISAFAERYLNSQSGRTTLKGYYSERAVTNLVLGITKLIHQSENKTDLFAKLIGTELHGDVMQQLLDADADEETFWTYFKRVYASQSTYYSYSHLKDDVLQCLESIFYSIVSNHESDALQLLIAAFENFEAEQFSAFEKKLADSACGGMIEKFYVNHMIHNALFCDELEARKNRLDELGVSTVAFVSQAADYFVELCGQCDVKDSEKSIEILKRIKNFIGDVPFSEEEEIVQLKKKFWKDFSWKNFDFFSDDVRIMKLQGNRKSDIISDILLLADFLSERSEILSKDIIVNCQKALCLKNKELSPAMQKKILKELSGLSDYRERMGLDLYLMIHYVPTNKKVNLKRSDISCDEFYSYLTAANAGENEMLAVDGVFDSIYHYLKKKKPAQKRSDSQEELKRKAIIKMMEHTAGNVTRRAHKAFYGTVNIESFCLCSLLSLFVFSLYVLLDIGVFCATVYSVITASVTTMMLNLSLKKTPIVQAFSVLFICFCVLLQILLLIL